MGKSENTQQYKKQMKASKNTKCKWKKINDTSQAYVYSILTTHTQWWSLQISKYKLTRLLIKPCSCGHHRSNRIIAKKRLAIHTSGGLGINKGWVLDSSCRIWEQMLKVLLHL
jgi:hypothetical protein